MPWTAERYGKPQEEGEQTESIAVLKRHAVCFFSLFGHKLGLIGLHLKSNPSDAQANAQRMAEAAIVRRIVQQEIVGRGHSPIILGDLNDYDPDVEMANPTRKTQTAVLQLLKDIDSQRDGNELVNAAATYSHESLIASHRNWDYNENGAADGDDVFTLIDHILLDKQLATGLNVCSSATPTALKFLTIFLWSLTLIFSGNFIRSIVTGAIARQADTVRKCSFHL